MNSEIINNEEKNEWPKLMVDNDGIVVLMDENNDGMVVYSKHPEYPVGTYSRGWCKFKPFPGKITLWN